MCVRSDGLAQTDFLNENTASFICELGRPKYNLGRPKCNLGIPKYNLGRPNWVDPIRPKHTRIESNVSREI